MNASSNDQELIEELRRLDSAPGWSPEKYRQLGLKLLQKVWLVGVGYDEQRMLKLVRSFDWIKNAAKLQRVPSRYYLYLQLARHIPDKDFAVYRKHKISWSQIRLIISALGHRKPQEEKDSLLADIRQRLQQHGAKKFTDYIEARRTTPKPRKQTDKKARRAGGLRPQDISIF